jgi:hypothetical protein
VDEIAFLAALRQAEGDIFRPEGWFPRGSQKKAGVVDFKLIWTESAIDDLGAIVRYILPERTRSCT